MTRLLRDEWGFQGMVMTDWLTTSDLSTSLSALAELKYPKADAAMCVLAQNDLIEPGEKADFTDKVMASMTMIMAHVFTLEGKTGEAKECLRNVLAMVRTFDAAPDFGIQTFHEPAFYKDAVFSDGLGASAEEGIEKLLSLLGNQVLSRMWKEVTEDAQ